MELQTIQSKIYEIRGQKVILDFDLAELYQSDTRSLNQAVKRNIKRFPLDFMFQLTTDEWSVRVCKLEITICDIKLGWHSETSLCIYRARCCYAVRTIEERYRNRSEYFNHACFRRHAPIPAQLRSLTPTQRTERTDRGIRRHHRGKRRKI